MHSSMITSFRVPPKTAIASTLPPVKERPWLTGGAVLLQVTKSKLISLVRNDQHGPMPQFVKPGFTVGMVCKGYFLM